MYFMEKAKPARQQHLAGLHTVSETTSKASRSRAPPQMDQIGWYFQGMTGPVPMHAEAFATFALCVSACGLALSLGLGVKIGCR
jgi:hypothetical protein